MTAQEKVTALADWADTLERSDIALMVLTAINTAMAAGEVEWVSVEQDGLDAVTEGEDHLIETTLMTRVLRAVTAVPDVTMRHLALNSIRNAMRAEVGQDALPATSYWLLTTPVRAVRGPVRMEGER